MADWAGRAEKILADAQDRRLRAEHLEQQAARMHETVAGRAEALRVVRAVHETRWRDAQRWVELQTYADPAARRLMIFDADFGLVSDRAAMLTAVLQAAISLGGADMGNVQVLDPSGGGLRIAAHYGFGTDFLDYFAAVDDQSTACGIALAQARTVHVHDVARSEVFGPGPARDVVLDAGVRAVRSIPLVGPDRRLLGVLSVHHVRPHSPTVVEQHVLAALATAAVRRLLHPGQTGPRGVSEARTV
jgi:hypothetical protein